MWSRTKILMLCLVSMAAALLVGIDRESASSQGAEATESPRVTLPRLPAARLEGTVTVLPSGFPVPLIFRRRSFDTARLSDVTRDGLRARREGIYAIDAGVRFPADPRGIRALFIALDEQRYIANHEDSANTDPARSTIYTVSTLARLKRGQTVRALAFQDTGGNMALIDDPRSFLTMHLVSR